MPSDSTDRRLSIAVSHPAEGTCLLTLSGDLDIASSAELAEQLETLQALGPAHVVVDIAGVHFIDSSGLNTLVVAAREAVRAGTSLVVAAPSRYVARVFDLVRMDESVTVVGSVDAALVAHAAADREGRS